MANPDLRVASYPGLPAHSVAMICAKMTSSAIGIKQIALLCLVLWLLEGGVSGARESGNSTCGVYGWPIPSPPEGAKLVQVHAIIRYILCKPYVDKA